MAVVIMTGSMAASAKKFSKEFPMKLAQDEFIKEALLLLLQANFLSKY